MLFCLSIIYFVILIPSIEQGCESVRVGDHAILPVNLLIYSLNRGIGWVSNWYAHGKIIEWGDSEPFIHLNSNPTWFLRNNCIWFCQLVQNVNDMIICWSECCVSGGYSLYALCAFSVTIIWWAETGVRLNHYWILGLFRLLYRWYAFMIDIMKYVICHIHYS